MLLLAIFCPIYLSYLVILPGMCSLQPTKKDEQSLLRSNWIKSLCSIINNQSLLLYLHSAQIFVWEACGSSSSACQIKSKMQPLFEKGKQGVNSDLSLFNLLGLLFPK